jgi:multiple sugar transport system substrate-binding protein
MFDYQTFYFMCGADKLFDQDDKPLFNSPAGLKALKLHKQLYDEKLVDPAMYTLVGYEEFFRRFSEGVSGMTVGWTSLYNYAKTHQASKIKDYIKVGPLPKIDRMASLLGPTGYAISKFSKNKDVALEWLKFVAGPEHTKGMTLRAGFLPVRKSVYQDPEFKKSHLAPMLEAAATQEQHYADRFMAPYAREISMEVLGFAVIKAIQNEMTPEEALAWAEKKAIEVVAKYK